MSFYQKYDLERLIADGDAKTFRAKENATGQQVFLHLFNPGGEPILAAIKAKFGGAPGKPTWPLLEIGDFAGSPYAVTDVIEPFTTLREWVATVGASPGSRLSRRQSARSGRRKNRSRLRLRELEDPPGAPTRARGRSMWTSSLRNQSSRRARLRLRRSQGSSPSGSIFQRKSRRSHPPRRPGPWSGRANPRRTHLKVCSEAVDRPGRGPSQSGRTSQSGRMSRSGGRRRTHLKVCSEVVDRSGRRRNQTHRRRLRGRPAIRAQASSRGCSAGAHWANKSTSRKNRPARRARRLRKTARFRLPETSHECSGPRCKHLRLR